MFCGHCGKQNPDDAKSCSNCGKKFEKTRFTKENTERIRLNKNQRISKPDFTKKIVPAVPITTKYKINMWLILTGLFTVFLIVIAFTFLMTFLDGNKTLEIAQIDDEASYQNNMSKENIAMSVDDWDKYNGNWSAGGYDFSFKINSSEIKCVMRKNDDFSKASAKIYAGEQSINIDLDEHKIKLIAIEQSKLKVKIDNREYDAIRTNSLPPDDDNIQIYKNDLNKYIFYSISSGTKTSNDEINIESSSQEFWPLDKFAISEDDLKRLTKNEIDIIKNEAYARHGYIFANQKLDNLFSSFDWYKPNTLFTESSFSKLERQNLDTIILYQRQKGWI